MAYRILKSNGQLLATIPDGTINTSNSSLGLPGRNYAGYGQTLDTNFVHITENFAKATPPANPLQGQLWYNTNANLLYVCPADGTTNAADWVPIAVAGGNTTTTFGTVNVNGNLNANNVIAVNSVQAANGAFTNISVTANANIATSSTITANIGTLTTQAITTGANTTTGTMNGTWTITGGLSGNSLVVANGNVYTTGIRTDGYYYSNGAPFNGTYTNGNVFDYLTGANSTPRFTGNIAPNLIAATGNINTTGNISATGNITGNYIIGNGSLLTGVSVSGGTTIVNGNSNVNIPAANGNVTISSAGNANIVVVTGTGANVAGTLSSTGNANVGNLGTTGVFATTLSSTGNANVGNLGTAGIITATGNISSSGNILVGNSTVIGTPDNTSKITAGMFQSIANITLLPYIGTDPINPPPPPGEFFYIDTAITPFSTWLITVNPGPGPNSTVLGTLSGSFTLVTAGLVATSSTLTPLSDIILSVDNSFGNILTVGAYQGNISYGVSVVVYWSAMRLL